MFNRSLFYTNPLFSYINRGMAYRDYWYSLLTHSDNILYDAKYILKICQV